MTFTGASTTSLEPSGPWYYGYSGTQSADSGAAADLFNIDSPRRAALLSKVQVSANLANFASGEELHVTMQLNDILVISWLVDGTAALLLQHLNVPFQFILPKETNMIWSAQTDSGDGIPVTAWFIGRRIE